MGKRIPLSNSRRLVDDIIWMAQKMPLASGYCNIDVREVTELRRKAKPRISWNTILMKAYAMVAAEMPELRSCYVPFPWPHMYVHETNVCMLTVARKYQETDQLLFARISDPEKQPLGELEAKLESFRRDPVDGFRQFRHQIQFAKTPFFLRRFVWWLIFGWCPRKKSRNMGTFGMSLSHFKGVRSLQLLAPGTGSLGVDLMPKNGVSLVSFTFDHRVMDGLVVVEVLDKVQKAIKGPIRDELRKMVEKQMTTVQNLPSFS